MGKITTPVLRLMDDEPLPIVPCALRVLRSLAGPGWLELAAAPACHRAFWESEAISSSPTGSHISAAFGLLSAQPPVPGPCRR